MHDMAEVIRQQALAFAEGINQIPGADLIRRALGIPIGGDAEQWARCLRRWADLLAPDPALEAGHLASAAALSLNDIHLALPLPRYAVDERVGIVAVRDLWIDRGDRKATGRFGDCLDTALGVVWSRYGSSSRRPDGQGIEWRLRDEDVADAEAECARLNARPMTIRPVTRDDVEALRPVVEALAEAAERSESDLDREEREAIDDEPLDGGGDDEGRIC